MKKSSDKADDSAHKYGCSSRRCTNPATALLTLILYVLAYTVIPGAPLATKSAVPGTCHCAMCRTDKDGTHHCPCCEPGEGCKCSMSESEKDFEPFAILDIPLLLTTQHSGILLLPGYFTTPLHESLKDAEHPVETPPPRA